MSSTPQTQPEPKKEEGAGEKPAEKKDGDPSGKAAAEKREPAVEVRTYEKEDAAARALATVIHSAATPLVKRGDIGAIVVMVASSDGGFVRTIEIAPPEDIRQLGPLMNIAAHARQWAVEKIESIIKKCQKLI